MLLEDENAGEAIESEEGEEAEEGDESPKVSDPLDLIEDLEERAEAKRLRAIAHRQLKKKQEAEPAPAEPSPFATKDDLKKMATNEAKKLVAPEVKELWDELTAIPYGGFDPMDAESVAKNMAKRYQLYLMDNPPASDDPASVLTTSKAIPVAGGSKAAPKQESRPLPGYKEPSQPTDWYK